MKTNCTPHSRIVAQSLSHIPASKRGEQFVLKCLGLTNGMSSPSTSAMKVYEDIFSDDLGNMQALCELFPPDGVNGCAQATSPRSAARA